jgi:hypothetical protein
LDFGEELPQPAPLLPIHAGIVTDVSIASRAAGRSCAPQVPNPCARSTSSGRPIITRRGESGCGSTRACQESSQPRTRRTSWLTSYREGVTTAHHRRSLLRARKWAKGCTVRSPAIHFLEEGFPPALARKRHVIRSVRIDHSF